MIDASATAAARTYANGELTGKALAIAERKIQRAIVANRKKGQKRARYSFARYIRVAVMVPGAQCDCGALATDLDHIIPHAWFSRMTRETVANITGQADTVKAFLSSRANAQPLCAVCNNKKSTRETKWTGTVEAFYKSATRANSAKRGAIKRGNNRAAFTKFAHDTYGKNLAAAKRELNVATRKGFTTRAHAYQVARLQDRFDYVCTTGEKCAALSMEKFEAGNRLTA